jgi:7-cyano-7-deazaguanine synthase
VKAVVLLSGGLDSAVTGFLAKKDGYVIYALTVNYGQRHLRELESARKIARKLGVVEHKIIDLDLRTFGGSALTDKKIKVPARKTKGIPRTYVPARNTIMLSIALAYAETVDADCIYIGVHHQDYSGYPDCRPEFIQAFQKMADLATKRSAEGRKIKILTPIINLNKKQIIKKGVQLGVPFEYTRSCYKEHKKSCGVCDSCRIRLKAFKQAGLKDPIEYEKNR